MTRHDQIMRIDFDEEMVQIMLPIVEALLHTGTDRREAKLAVIQDLQYLDMYFPEVNKEPIMEQLAGVYAAYPINRDPMPLGLELERNATLSAMEKIGRTIRAYDYSYDECKRMTRMMQSLIKYHLKGSDNDVRSVHKALLD